MFKYKNPIGIEAKLMLTNFDGDIFYIDFKD